MTILVFMYGSVSRVCRKMKIHVRSTVACLHTVNLYRRCREDCQLVVMIRPMIPENEAEIARRPLIKHDRDASQVELLSTQLATMPNRGLSPPGLICWPCVGISISYLSRRSGNRSSIRMMWDIRMRHALFARLVIEQIAFSSAPSICPSDYIIGLKNLNAWRCNMAGKKERPMRAQKSSDCKAWLQALQLVR